MSPKEYRAQGRYFEEFEIGDSMVSPGRTITEADIVAFCGLSGDFNELHSNVEYAKGSLFGKPVAHGLLGLAVASGLSGRLGFLEGTAQAFMGLEWKFKRPIFAGDTIQVRATVAQKKEVKSLKGGVVVLDVAVLNQNHEVVQEGRWTVLMKSRE
ncbi:MAG: MaoC family dehydratase N-terminal domain-containing protein [Chloroflexi bacterium]|nr:MaoC family dehydratase N-terminal domain-containing protein [Chloroflexota bacterium]